MELERKISFLVESNNDYKPVSLFFLFLSFLLFPFSWPWIFLRLARVVSLRFVSVAFVRLPFSVSASLLPSLKLPTRTEIFAESPALFRHHAFGQYVIVKYCNTYFHYCQFFFNPVSCPTFRYDAHPCLYALAQIEICSDQRPRSFAYHPLRSFPLADLVISRSFVLCFIMDRTMNKYYVVLIQRKCEFMRCSFDHRDTEASTYRKISTEDYFSSCR